MLPPHLTQPESSHSIIMRYERVFMHSDDSSVTKVVFRKWKEQVARAQDSSMTRVPGCSLQSPVLSFHLVVASEPEIRQPIHNSASTNAPATIRVMALVPKSNIHL